MLKTFKLYLNRNVQYEKYENVKIIEQKTLSTKV